MRLYQFQIAALCQFTAAGDTWEGVAACAAPGGEKEPFAPHEAERYNIRTSSARVNGRLNDEFAGSTIFVPPAPRARNALNDRLIDNTPITMRVSQDMLHPKTGQPSPL